MKRRCLGNARHDRCPLVARFEPLEARHLLSASGLVEPLSNPPGLLPVIDLNGSLAGTSYGTTLPLSVGVAPLADEALNIQAATTHLAEVRLRIDNSGLVIQPVDTSGTNIQAFFSGTDYVLAGFDTVANYETVLRRVQVCTLVPLPRAGVVSVFAVDEFHREGPQAHRGIEFIDQQERLTVNLSGSGLYDGKYNVSGPPVAVPGLTGVTIDAGGQTELQEAIIGFGYGGGLIEVDTTGTSIQSQWFGNHLRLLGNDTVANYEKVLRTAEYSAFNPPLGERVAFITQVIGNGSQSDPAFSQLAIVPPAAPAIDLNGDAPGIDYAPDYYLGRPEVAIVDAEGLSIDFPANLSIDGARITFDGGFGALSVDTSGTSINAAMRPDGLELFGTDTVANYERVLRSAVLGGAQGLAGGVMHLRFKLFDQELGYGPTATTTLVLRLMGPPEVDLNGAAAGDDYATAYLVGPAVPLVSPDLTIRAETPTLVSALVESNSGALVTVDTLGTNIQAMPGPGGVALYGFDTVANYEAVLRTLKVEGLGGAVGQTVYFNIGVNAVTGAGSVAATRVDVRYPGPPIIHFGTGSAGIVNETTYYLDSPPVLVLPADFSIAADLAFLQGALLAYGPESSAAVALAVDTTGTNIQAWHTQQGLQLWGMDTIENYEQVLRTATVAIPFAQPGSTRQIQLTVNVEGFISPPATTLVRVMAPPPPVIDLNGDVPGRNLAVGAHQGGATPLVDPDHLVIHAPGVSMLSGIDILVPNLPSGFLQIFTQGTAIEIFGDGINVYLRGEASIEDYESVLRTLRLVETTPATALGTTIHIEIAARYTNPLVGTVIGPASVSSITFLDVAPPQLDINGPLPGSTVYVDYFLQGPPVPIAPDLVITAWPSVISEARIAFSPFSPPQFTFDTAGTNIFASFENDTLVFQGVASSEDYQAVLRSVAVIGPFFATGGSSLEITVANVGGRSAAVNSVVTTLPPLWSVIDLNGPKPGTSDEAVVRADSTGQRLFSNALDIASPFPMLQNASISLNGWGTQSLHVDTTGTNITAIPAGSALELFGSDTVENYERVLRSARLESAHLPVGQLIPAQVMVGGAFGPSYLFLTVVGPAPALVDLSGSEAYEHYEASATAGGPAVPIVDPQGATIQAQTEMLGGLEVQLSNGPGQLAVDTSGTSLNFTVTPYSLVVHGQAPVAEYVQVLRTLTLQPYPLAAPSMRADIFVFDPTGQRSPLAQSFISIEEPAASVVARQLFYNNSKFDGLTPGFSPLDYAAIDPSKSGYLGLLAQPSAASSYSRGINGIIIDVADLGSSLSPNDFTFKIGTSDAPANWQMAPAPSEFVVRPGEGANGSDRIVLIWPDGAIQNTWLQVTLKGNDEIGGYNAATGLAASDVFYFASRVGDTFLSSSPGAFTTNAADEVGARLHLGFGAQLSNIYDFNRDMLVNASDSIIARANVGLLRRLNLPAAAQPAAPVPASADEPNRAVLASALAASSSTARHAELVSPDVSLRSGPRSLVTVRDASHAEVLARSQWQAVATAVSQLDSESDEELLAASFWRG